MTGVARGSGANKSAEEWLKMEAGGKRRS